MLSDVNYEAVSSTPAVVILSPETVRKMVEDVETLSLVNSELESSLEVAEDMATQLRNGILSIMADFEDLEHDEGCDGLLPCPRCTFNALEDALEVDVVTFDVSTPVIDVKTLLRKTEKKYPPMLMGEPQPHPFVSEDCDCEHMLGCGEPTCDNRFHDILEGIYCCKELGWLCPRCSDGHVFRCQVCRRP